MSDASCVMRQVFVRLCQRVTGRQYASTGEWRKSWAQNLTLYRKRQRMVRSSAQLRRDTTIALLDVNQHMLSIWHNREQKSASAAELLQGVCLPDRLHTLAEPAPPARDLPQLPPQPTADRRPKHQLELPADIAGTSFWRAKKREEMEAKGFVRPARAFLCKICHEDVKASPTHDRYFGKVYCPSDPEQRLSVRKWRRELRRTILAKDAERSIYAGLDDQRLVADIMGETNLRSKISAEELDTLEPVVSGRTGKERPAVLYRDRDFCLAGGAQSCLQQLFGNWCGLVITLDAWHFMRRFALGITDGLVLHSMQVERLDQLKRRLHAPNRDLTVPEPRFSSAEPRGRFRQTKAPTMPGIEVARRLDTLEPVARGLFTHLERAGKEQPAVLYRDRDFCLADGAQSCLQQLFGNWRGLVITLDAWHEGDVQLLERALTCHEIDLCEK
ncbi:hypothetical protein FJT64_018409 [Amphibalanus amphitrite]|uniref:Uncharacterized protein n=1 Tax=Amphibalanus amphitrite TaxID=1232801 RepID=A0A6A4WXK9_AMPAM|nr:hypothetical protein FJT64_018409 [Amphibalanus amphitrite]